MTWGDAWKFVLKRRKGDRTEALKEKHVAYNEAERFGDLNGFADVEVDEWDELKLSVPTTMSCWAYTIFSESKVPWWSKIRHSGAHTIHTENKAVIELDTENGFKSLICLRNLVLFVFKQFTTLVWMGIGKACVKNCLRWLAKQWKIDEKDDYKKDDYKTSITSIWGLFYGHGEGWKSNAGQSDIAHHRDKFFWYFLRSIVQWPERSASVMDFTISSFTSNGKSECRCRF